MVIVDDAAVPKAHLYVQPELITNEKLSFVRATLGGIFDDEMITNETEDNM